MGCFEKVKENVRTVMKFGPSKPREASMDNGVETAKAMYNRFYGHPRKP